MSDDVVLPDERAYFIYWSDDRNLWNDGTAEADPIVFFGDVLPHMPLEAFVCTEAPVTGGNSPVRTPGLPGT